MTDDTGVVMADTFSADANDAGTLIFKSTRITSAANTARFRVTSDAVVGTFPFESAQVASSAPPAPMPGLACTSRPLLHRHDVRGERRHDRDMQ